MSTVPKKLQNVMCRIAVVSGVLALVLLPALTPASALMKTYSIGNTSTCPGNSETCASAHPVGSFTSASDPQLTFDDTSCEDISLILYVDGTEAGQTPYGTPGSNIPGFTLAWPSDGRSHILTVAAEGRVSGCNTSGVLTSWSASLEIITQPLSGVGSAPAPPSGVDLGGLSVASYCSAVTHSTSVLIKGAISGPNFARNNWACEANESTLDMQQVCQWTYGATHTGVVAYPTDANNAYSWNCYATGAGIAGMTSGPMNRTVMPIASTIGTPRQIFSSMSNNLINALVTVAAMLLITFPANVFNSTLAENYDTILAILERTRRRLRSLILLGDGGHNLDATPSAPPSRSSEETPGRATRPWFYLVLLVGALLGGLLNPNFGVNSQSAMGLVATIGAFIVAAALGWFVAKLFRSRHQYPTQTYRRALPLGLVVAALCVLISRLTNFEPGYLYGVVVGIGFVGSLEERHNAHLTALSVVSTLGVAVLSWLMWIPCNHLAQEPGANFLIVILDDVLASVFIGGLVGTVIGLLPLEFLPGGTLAKWRKDVWAVVFFVALFLLVQVELRPAAGPGHPGGAPVVTVITLFVVFGALSFGMQRYFAGRARRDRMSPEGATHALSDSAPTSPTSTSGT